jgi:hypothetical protein
MVQMMTRSMYKKLANEGPQRMTTRSMTKHMPQKRFHEDPYPSTKRQRIHTQEHEPTFVMRVWNIIMVTFLFLWYVAVLAWFAWFYHSLYQKHYENYGVCPVKPNPMYFESIHESIFLNDTFASE